jgi:predicted ribosomally synthesized peptide with SipW-like signal peptide
VSSPAARVLLALAVLAGLGTAGTYAAWNASATLSPGRVSAGTLDLTLDGGLVGPGGSSELASFGLASMVPGEGVARVVTVANAGTTPLRLTATGYATGALSSDLVVALHPGGVAVNTGTAAAGTRRGTCSGAASYPPATLGGTGRPVLAARTMANGTSLPVCVVVTLSASAPSSQQGQSGQVRVRFDAAQVGAP